MVYSVVILYRELFVKLYSKRHLVLTALVTTFVLGSVFFGFYYGKSYFAENTHNVANSENKSSVQEENLFQLQTAQPAAIQISRDSDYTVEEAQNIYVYELCNEAVVNINTQTMGLNWFLEPVSLEGGSGSG